MQGCSGLAVPECLEDVRPASRFSGGDIVSSSGEKCTNAVSLAFSDAPDA